MRVQGRPKGKGARLSRKVPDPQQMPIVRARLRNSNLVPADMEGRAIPTADGREFLPNTYREGVPAMPRKNKRFGSGTSMNGFIYAYKK